MTVAPTTADAYSSTASAWQRGPERVYERLAARLVDAFPVPIAGCLVLDVGAGTGAATRAAARRGARVIAVDIAFGMLAADSRSRPPAAVGDALALPFGCGAFDAVVAAFSLNHLKDPAAGLREAARVTRRRGAIVAAAYALDDWHPVRDATEAAARSHGWVPERWYESIRDDAIPRLATVDRAVAVARRAALTEVDAVNVRVSYPDLGPDDLVAWRLGMAHLAPFVASLPVDQVERLTTDAVVRLGDAPVLERSAIILSGRAP